MATMFIRHQVADYAQWRQIYDAFAPTQQRLGVTAEAVYRAADNPNDVTVTHDFASLEAAQQFAKSDELHSAMGQAGVVGAPTVWFTTKA
jgi:hypothetical protein